tara:strand:+ start:386 stop:892 length:507 start_codon:yes stop_codon:yes gene_type:complete
VSLTKPINESDLPYGIRKSAIYKSFKKRASFMKYRNHLQICKIASKYYRDDKFCAVLALAVATGIGYGKAFHTLKKLGRKTRHGTPRPMQFKAYETLGFQVESNNDLSRALRCKTTKAVGKIAHRLKGTYLVHCTSHVGVVHDGVYHDWAADRNKRNICIYKVNPINN